MIRKVLTLSLGFSLTLFGMEYQTFKEEVRKHAKILQSQDISLQMAEEESRILLRSSNPELGLELAGYDQDAGDTTLGYAASLRQRVRTGSFMEGLKMKVKASELLAKAYTAQGRAGYMKTLEKLYTEYVYESQMLTLLVREQKLLARVAHMVQIRYQSGSDTKVSYLQAKSEADVLNTQIYTAKAKKETLYRQLLSIASLQKEVALDAKFIYPVSLPDLKNIKTSPEQQLLYAKEKLYKSQYRMNQKSFQSYDIVASVEEEPDQTIGRVGVDIPLALFNTRKEERSLAKLKMHRAKLQNEQLAIETEAQKRIHLNTIKALVSQYRALKRLQGEQQELVTLLEEGYKIAKSSVFNLMRAKNKLIETRKALLKTQKEINEQTIALRFLEGAYND